jgi:hypothetical protein
MMGKGKGFYGVYGLVRISLNSLSIVLELSLWQRSGSIGHRAMEHLAIS